MVLIVALALTVAIAAADDRKVEIRPASQAPVELLSPVPGSILEGGREAEIAWRPAVDLASLGIEEWEAFLSFDDGRSWPVRATPHLSAGVESFRFTVPQVSSARTRLMLRFGDERREVAYVMPGRIQTVATQVGSPLAPRPVMGYGETAHHGACGVVLWADGPRDGRRMEMAATVWHTETLTASDTAHLPLWIAFADLRRLMSGLDGTIDSKSAPVTASRTPLPAVPALICPFLLLFCRRNE